MTNLNMLEYLRTKEELINYFKEKGKNITEAEIEAIKQSYVKAESNGNTLAMQQLDDVAGGIFFHIKIDGSGVLRYYYEDNNTNDVTVFNWTRHLATAPTELQIYKGMTLGQFCHTYGKAAEIMASHATELHSDEKVKDLKSNFEAKSLKPNTQVLMQNMYDTMSKPGFRENLARQVLAKPFNKDLRDLKAKHLTGDKLGSIGENLMHYVESKNHRVQALVNIAAMHNNIIRLASEADKLPHHLNLIQGMAHNLDNWQYCSEHMKNAIEITNIGEDNYYKILKAAARASFTSNYALLRLSQIIVILPNSYKQGDVEFICSCGKDHVAAEVFARLFELYVATDGSWKVNEFNLREIFPELTNAFEREIQTVFNRAISEKVELPSQAIKMPPLVKLPLCASEMIAVAAGSFDREENVTAPHDVTASTTTTIKIYKKETSNGDSAFYTSDDGSYLFKTRDNKIILDFPVLNEKTHRIIWELLDNKDSVNFAGIIFKKVKCTVPWCSKKAEDAIIFPLTFNRIGFSFKSGKTEVALSDIPDVAAAAVEPIAYTTSEKPVTIPEEFIEIKVLNIDGYITPLTLCEKTTDKTKYIIRESLISGTQVYKVIKEFENEDNNIYIYADSQGFLSVCGILKDGSVFNENIFLMKLMKNSHPFSKSYPELFGLIIKNVEPFVSKYDQYCFNQLNIELNGEVKFERTEEIIKVVVDGASYKVTKYVSISTDAPSDCVYAYNGLILEKKQTANGEIIYVIPTENGEYYRWDFGYGTYGEKIEKEKFVDVPPSASEMPAAAAAATPYVMGKLTEEKIIFGPFENGDKVLCDNDITFAVHNEGKYRLYKTAKTTKGEDVMLFGDEEGDIILFNGNLHEVVGHTEDGNIIYKDTKTRKNLTLTIQVEPEDHTDYIPNIPNKRRKL